MFFLCKGCTVLADLKKINFDTNFTEIRNMNKDLFLSTVKRKIENEAHKYLENMKENHLKVKFLKQVI